jgi:hypothetical protein
MTFRVRPRLARRGPAFSVRLVVAALVLAANFFAAAIASAQTTAGASIAVLNESSLPRLDKNGNLINKRPLTLNPEAVNLQDCLDEQQIRFTLQMAGFEANGSVQRWAANNGVDCSAPTTRSGGFQQCWQLGGNLPLSQNVNADIPVRAIISGALTPATPDSSAAICGKVDLTTISVQFLYFSPGNPSQAASAKAISVIADTIGPDPPGGLTALPGNTRISVSWASISGGDTGDSGTAATSGGGLTSLTGVKVYCDPATGAAATSTPAAPVCETVSNDGGATTVDAGDGGTATTTVDAGTSTVCSDGGTSTTAPASTCTSPNFVDPNGGKIFPDAAFAAKYECGEITGNSGTTVVASSVAGAPLVNGTSYAVAVAATDAYGNAGPLSSVICKTPQPTTDFWEDYKNAGGRAGGCSTGSAELPLGSMSVIGVLMALAISSARRRRDSRASRGNVTERDR